MDHPIRNFEDSPFMYIIGIHNDEDSGVCLFRDGQLLDAINEERLSRVKMQKGFPHKALAHVLDRHGLTLQDVGAVAYGWYGRRTDYADYAKRLTERVTLAMARDPGCGEIIRQRVSTEFDRDSETRAQFEAEMAALGMPSERIFFLDHHASHAWGAFACSPFDQALVFTFDGRGDLKSSTVSHASIDGGLTELDYMLSFDSLGFLYGQITHFLGFTPHRHEGKVTGLAAHGDPEATRSLFERMIKWEEGRFVANLGFYKPFYTNQGDDLRAELSRFSREDIAAGVQAHTERLVTAYVAHWVGKRGGGPVDVCLAGGVCANVRVNQLVAEIPGVRRVFVFPHMGDGGLAVGAACCHMAESEGRTKVQFPGIYLGPSFEVDEVAAEVVRAGDALDVHRPADWVGAAVEDLVEQRIVGFFDGRMEFGPRALGARSILVHTRDASMNDWLNKKLHRTEFMPFAPVVPEEFAAESFIGWQAGDLCSPFMTRTYACTPAFAERHPAVVHIDGTARPQTVTEERNGDYYRVVRRYCDRSGDKALINTSFNQHEEPIVCSPADAIGSLLRGNIEVLYIGGYRLAAR